MHFFRCDDSDRHRLGVLIHVFGPLAICRETVFLMVLCVSENLFISNELVLVAGLELPV